MAKIQSRRGQCGVVSRIEDMYLSPALLILIFLPSACKGLHENFCNVVPKDQYIEVGSDTVIVCKTSCVTGKIYWTLNNKRIDESLSNTINSTHTALSLRNFTHRTATLQCHSADTDQVLGGTTITTYTKPSKISCIFHYEDQETLVPGVPELFTCSWEHQIDSSSKTKINYTVLSVSSSDPSQSEICSSHTTTCTSIYRDIRYKMSLSLDYVNVTVRAESAFWEVSSDPYSFMPLNILKITHPVLNVTANSEDVVVEWIIRSSVYPKYHCRVKYSKDFNEGASEWWLNKTLSSHEKGKMTIKEVESCTNYTFAVRCALDEAPWSDWSPETTVLTKLKKSDLKLRLWRKVGEAEKNGFRKVHALWTVIPSTCQGTFTYSIIQTPYKENMTGVYYTGTLCANSVCDVNQEAHRIQLTVHHNEDLFVNDSVYVPAITESLPQVTDIQTSSHEGVILVSWKAPAQPVSGYMIDYTHNGDQYDWRETQDTNITLFDLLDKKPYNITVTPLFDDKTGRGTQALQICSGFGAPGNITDIDIQPKHKSAVVSWNLKLQEACSGVVVKYTVFYSIEEDPQSKAKQNVTVDNTMLQALLEDLKPQTQYRLYVKATALTGTTKSTERVFSTTRFDPGLITAVGVCGGILIVLVLSLGLCCAIEWKKFKEKHVPDPSLASSVATWPSPSRGKPFHDPSESIFERVYTEEPRRTSTSPPATGFDYLPTSDCTDEYADPATLPAPVIQDEVPVEPAETQDASSPGESTALLSSDNSPSSPYRSQTSVETLTSRTSKSSTCVPVRQQEKASQPTVYVSLDMFEQVQGR